VIVISRRTGCSESYLRCDGGRFKRPTGLAATVSRTALGGQFELLRLPERQRPVASFLCQAFFARVALPRL
jgi:hypothetical protein